MKDRGPLTAKRIWFELLVGFVSMLLFGWAAYEIGKGWAS